MRRIIVLIGVALTAVPGLAQDVVSLGVNPNTELNEIRVNLPGSPPSAKPLDMVLIPAGTFVMGTGQYEDGNNDERPEHQVTITKPFYLGKYEVTQAQWEAVMGSNPSSFTGRPNNPVEQVSWDDCRAFTDKMNERGLGVFRMPTEAEWEYACRAGTQTRFYWGYDPKETLINYYAWCGRNNNPTGSKEVARLRPNPWGLYDMSGNVWEWCRDWYGPYTSGSVTDPKGQQAASKRVIRGGCWFIIAKGCRSVARVKLAPSDSTDSLGFRLVLEASSLCE